MPKITQKNGLLCNREQPNLFIKRPSLNIMDMLRHRRFGCYAVYDKAFLRRDESGGFWANNGRMEKFWIFCQASLNAAM